MTSESSSTKTKSLTKAVIKIIVGGLITFGLVAMAFLATDAMIPEAAPIVTIVIGIIGGAVYTDLCRDAYGVIKGSGKNGNIIYTAVGLVLLISCTLILFNALSSRELAYRYLSFDVSPRSPSGTETININIETSRGLRWGRQRVFFHLVPRDRDESHSTLSHHETVFFAYGLRFQGLRQQRRSLPAYSFSSDGAYDLFIFINGKPRGESITLMGAR